MSSETNYDGIFYFILFCTACATVAFFALLFGFLDRFQKISARMQYLSFAVRSYLFALGVTFIFTTPMRELAALRLIPAFFFVLSFILLYVVLAHKARNEVAPSSSEPPSPNRTVPFAQTSEVAYVDVEAPQQVQEGKIHGSTILSQTVTPSTVNFSSVLTQVLLCVFLHCVIFGLHAGYEADSCRYRSSRDVALYVCTTIVSILSQFLAFRGLKSIIYAYPGHMLVYNSMINYCIYIFLIPTVLQLAGGCASDDTKWNLFVARIIIIGLYFIAIPFGYRAFRGEVKA